MITNNLLSPSYHLCMHKFSHQSVGYFFCFSFVYLCNSVQQKTRFFYLSAISFTIYIILYIYMFFLLSVALKFQRISLDTCVWMRISTRKCYEYRTMTVPRVYRFRKSWNQFFHSFNTYSFLLLTHSLTHSFYSLYDSLGFLKSLKNFIYIFIIR